jgi:hypothetical protein
LPLVFLKPHEEQLVEQPQDRAVAFGRPSTRIYSSLRDLGAELAECVA